MSRVVREEPSAFTPILFNQGLVVAQAASGPVVWSRSTVVRLDAFQMRDGEVVRDTSTTAVEVSGEALSRDVMILW